MGNPNQLAFIRDRAARLSGPFLEIGSRDYGNTQNLRALFAPQAERAEYVGIDLEAGPGVDVVLDLTRPFEEIDAALHAKRFGTIFCLSVLEHCDKPFAMAENLTRLLAPGGALCVSSPFAFKFHAYPDDYWRFTHQGIRRLFSGIDFPDADAAWYTSREGDFHPIGDGLGRLDLRPKRLFRQGKAARAVLCALAGSVGRLVGLHRLVAYPYVLAPSDVIMLGTLPK